MHCGVMVTGYNQGDWERLLKGDYDRPPTVSDAQNMDDALTMGELVEPFGFDSIWATEHYGSAFRRPPFAPRPVTRARSRGGSRRHSRRRSRHDWPPSMAWGSSSSPATISPR